MLRGSTRTPKLEMNTMKAGEDFYKNLLDNLHDGVYFVDLERKITYWNSGAERITGYKGSEIEGSCCADNILMHIDDKGTNLCEELCPLRETMIDGRPREAEVHLHHKEGHRLPVLVRTSPIRDSKGRIVGAVEVFSDNSPGVTARQKIEELQELSLLDSLTGVGNRRYVEMSLHARLNEMHRYGSTFGVLFIDLDRYKRINDAHGHDIGDLVLKMATKTLSANLRPFDMLGRWGGEEFIAVIINVNEGQLYSIADRLRMLVGQSALPTEKGNVRVTVSIGATLARPDDTVLALVKRADNLMYQSKLAGRNCVSM